MSKINPINYRTRRFFENGMNGHNAVESIKKIDNNIYRIERTDDRPALNVYITDIYIAGEADICELDFHEIHINCIVLIGYNNRYSYAAKEMAKNMGVGLFVNREFLGAINFVGIKFINYEPKEKDN